MSSALTVSIHGISAHGRHGVFPEERELGQRFVVDVDMVLAGAAAARSDRLDDTVDYGDVAARVARIIEGDPVDLIERLADLIADALLADGRVAEVTVRVVKPDVRLPVAGGPAFVTLRRSR